MPMEPGHKLSNYRLVEKIGEGGMGIVWKAVDTMLDREVAVKILPPAFSADKDRLARFEREARLLASLNHPGIAAVFGLDVADEQRFLAMEFVPGEDLYQRLARGRMPMDEVLAVALAIAEALEAAHDNGVVHRDLKPANIRLTPDGKVKVLDFGLAKVVMPDAISGGSHPSRSPQLTAEGTAAGSVMGTAAYMSPEQAKGKSVDRRADIWAFGVVLLEMLTGIHPFKADTVSETLAAVIMKDMDLDALPPGTSPELRRLLQRCLRKDARSRLRDIGDARVVIQEILSGDALAGGAAAEAAGAGRGRSGWILPLGSGLVLGGLLAGAALWSAKTPPPVSRERPSWIEMALPDDIPIAAGSFICPMDLSPDGSHLVYVGVHEGVRRLYVRDLTRLGFAPLPGTEGAEGPFFSPDGEWVGFYADGKLMKASLAGGGLPQKLVDLLDFRGAAWGADGVIVYAAGQRLPLSKIPAQGGTPEPITHLDEAAGEWSHRFPHFTPDGKTLLFTAHTGAFDFNEGTIWAQSMETGERTKILDGGPDARILPNGFLLYIQAGSLLAVPIDLATMKPKGPERTVAEHVAVQFNTGAALFTVSSRGDFAYIGGEATGDDARIVWADRAGEAEEFAVARNVYRFPRLSPDGRELSVQAIGGNRGGSWVSPTDSPSLSRLSTDLLVTLWGPESKRLFYTAYENGTPSGRIVAKAFDGTGTETTIYEHTSVARATSISSDGKKLLFMASDPETKSDIWILPLEAGSAAQPLLETPAQEGGGRFSPDGRFMVYVTDETGRFEINVMELSGPGGNWLISSEGGYAPVWAPNGREIFYRNGENVLTVPVQTSPVFKAGTPEVLFQGGYEGLIDSIFVPNYDVTADGSRLLMIRSPELDIKAPAITIVLHGADQLETAK